ncbi:MAG: type II toxin-antitoxin system VapC family toxin [Chloroflexota bacterium]
MIYVPDTHALVWYVTADKRLGKRAKAALASVDDGASQAIVSVLILAEIMYLQEHGRIQVNLKDLIARLQSNANYGVVPLDLDTVMTAEKVKQVPELFDRMILATTIKHRAALITRDSVFENTDAVEIIW